MVIRHRPPANPELHDTWIPQGSPLITAAATNRPFDVAANAIGVTTDIRHDRQLVFPRDWLHHSDRSPHRDPPIGVGPRDCQQIANRPESFPLPQRKP